MAPPPPPSKLRVSVHWTNPAVFAGEDIECTITFTNIATPGQHSRRSQNGAAIGHRAAPSAAQVPPKKLEPLAIRDHASSGAFTEGFLPTSRIHSATSQALPPQDHPSVQIPPRGRSHRPALSLNLPFDSSKARNHTASVASPNSTPKPGKQHGRSLSIISIATDVTLEDGRGNRRSSLKRNRPAHQRSASMQVPYRSPGALNDSPGRRAATQPSNLLSFSYPPGRTPSEVGVTASSSLSRDRRRSHLSSISPPRESEGASSPETPIQSFKFPAAPAADRTPSGAHLSRQNSGASRVRTPQRPSQSNRLPEDGLYAGPAASSQVARIISASSMHDTPRSSGEFYSMGSNNSNETLASEYVGPQPAARLFQNRAVSNHNASDLLSPTNNRIESLMMGYVQVVGNFTVDGSLINQAPFEDVKRKGVLGSQGGGGVVGIERSKRDSGLFGALGWGNFGESLGGLLGVGELSSIKEMRGAATAKTVPLLSTPQSILFVDLRLGAGESRSFKYSFSLPAGLPPSHKGRAMKINYHITIGTQRSGSTKDQNVKQVEVPFRVLGSVNAQGEILVHNVMSPHIVLSDTATTQMMTPRGSPSPSASPQPAFPFPRASRPPSSPSKQANSLADFIAYANGLLTRHQSDELRPSSSSNAVSGSVAWTKPRRTSSITELEPQNMKERIDFAIMRKGLSRPGPDSTNIPSATVFRIARSSHPVATISLNRSAFRLGEVVYISVDFAATATSILSSLKRPSSSTVSSSDRINRSSSVEDSTNYTARRSRRRKLAAAASPSDTSRQSFTVRAHLETIESIDTALALRSASSIDRVTRRVHASGAEWVGFARRVVFALQIPSHATPEFSTTGFGMKWTIRVEFSVDATQSVPALLPPFPSSQQESDVTDGDSEGMSVNDVAGAEKDDDDDVEDDEDSDTSLGPKAVGGSELMEEVRNDARGIVLAPIEKVSLETFEVSVPIRVYGAVASIDPSGGKTDGIFSEGDAVGLIV